MKKNVLFILGGVVVAIALVVMLVFVLTGDDTGSWDVSKINIDGTWKVVARENAGAASIVADEYAVFSGNTVSYYRAGESEPYDTRSFTLKPGDKYMDLYMTIEGVARDYVLSVASDNYIIVYENETTCMRLIRHANTDRSEVPFDKAVLTGKWDVAFRTMENGMIEEQLEFLDGTLNDYRNGAATPAASSAYTWNDDNCFTANAWGMEMECHQLSEDVIFLVETATGLVWEIHKAA